MTLAAMSRNGAIRSELRAESREDLAEAAEFYDRPTVPLEFDLRS